MNLKTGQSVYDNILPLSLYSTLLLYGRQQRKFIFSLVSNSALAGGYGKHRITRELKKTFEQGLAQYRVKRQSFCYKVPVKKFITSRLTLHLTAILSKSRALVCWAGNVNTKQQLIKRSMLQNYKCYKKSLTK